VAEACSALGLRPAAVRLRIRAGELAAVQVGRRWRIGLTSLNAILAGAEAPTAQTAAVTTVVSEPMKPCPSPSPTTSSAPPLIVSQPAIPAPPAAESVAVQPRPKQLFSDGDMVWIARYRRDLSDPHPAVRAEAKHQLSMFAQAAEQDATRRVAARMTEEECKATAAALVAGLSRGDRTWF
jgi:excisionase family DNA binding protein